MKKWTLGLMAFAAGAGAMYLLDSRYGPQRRAQLGERAQRWWTTAQSEVQQRGHGLLDRARAALQPLRDRLLHGRETFDDADGLEPLSMTPEPLERRHTRSAVPTALAVAAPVALAVGAVWWKRDDGSSLH